MVNISSYSLSPYSLKNWSKPVLNRSHFFPWVDKPRTDIDLRAPNWDRKFNQTGYSPVRFPVLFWSVEPDLKALCTEQNPCGWWTTMVFYPGKQAVTLVPTFHLQCHKSGINISSSILSPTWITLPQSHQRFEFQSRWLTLCNSQQWFKCAGMIICRISRECVNWYVSEKVVYERC